MGVENALLEALEYFLLAFMLAVLVLRARLYLFIRGGSLREPLGWEKGLLSSLAPSSASSARIYLFAKKPWSFKLAGLIRRGEILGVALWPGVVAVDPGLLVYASTSARGERLLKYILAHEEGHLKTFYLSILVFSASIGVSGLAAGLLPEPLSTLVFAGLAVVSSMLSILVSEKIADRYAEKLTGITRRSLREGFLQAL